LSDEKLREYRTQIRRLRDLVGEARQVSIAMIEEGLPARNVRSCLYKAILSLDRAAQHVDEDLINQDQTERDLS